MASPAMPVNNSTMLDGSGVVTRLKLTVPSGSLALLLAPPSSVNVPRKVPNGEPGGTVNTNKSPVKLAPGARDSGKLAKKSLSSRVTGAVMLKLSPFKNTAPLLPAGADTVASYVRLPPVTETPPVALVRVKGRVSAYAAADDKHTVSSAATASVILSFIISSVLSFKVCGY